MGFAATLKRLPHRGALRLNLPHRGALRLNRVLATKFGVSRTFANQAVTEKNLIQPLAGVTVVALEQAVAAPFSTSRLADAGARVDDA